MLRFFQVCLHSNDSALFLRRWFWHDTRYCLDTQLDLFGRAQLNFVHTIVSFFTWRADWSVFSINIAACFRSVSYPIPLDPQVRNLFQNADHHLLDHSLHLLVRFAAQVLLDLIDVPTIRHNDEVVSVNEALTRPHHSSKKHTTMTVLGSWILHASSSPFLPVTLVSLASFRTLHWPSTHAPCLLFLSSSSSGISTYVFGLGSVQVRIYHDWTVFVGRNSCIPLSSRTLLDSVVEFLDHWTASVTFVVLLTSTCLMAMGRRLVLSIACTYDTVLCTPMNSTYFISNRQTSFVSSRAFHPWHHLLIRLHRICDGRVLIIAYLIFCVCMDDLAKHDYPNRAVLKHKRKILAIVRIQRSNALEKKT